MTDPLPPGLYEALLTRGLEGVISERRGSGWRIFDQASPAHERPEALARHIYLAARRALASVTGEPEEKLARQVLLVNDVLDLLERRAAEGAVRAADAVLDEARLLLEAQPPDPSGIAAREITPRPHLALSQSGLLVNGPRDCPVGTELAREIASADRIDLLCAFVRFAGLRLVRDPLHAFIERGGDLRVIASVYTGTTEKRALDELVSLGARVKVSFETAQTRLHAKAWLFHRDSGFSTAYVGSSNLTHAALLDGLEWNVRLSQSDNPGILERVAATFEQYWAESEFADYEPGRDGERLEKALGAERGGGVRGGVDELAIRIDLEPKPHQLEMLEALDAERRRGHARNLVVSATGTGKTWVAAFDFRRLREAGLQTLLFVAHREEILRQSCQVFQLVLAEPGFGEVLVAGERPAHGRHVFASIQSLAQRAEDIDPRAYDVVIVDEFHHAAAPTYDRLLRRLEPRVMLGLTATPERADGKSVLEWFDGRMACEVRLWQALEQGLLCPFHYFGVHDGTDLSQVAFKRGRYDLAELDRIYTGDDARVQRILQALHRQILDPGRMRALGFCAGVGHAELMARRFCDKGLPSIALHARSPETERRSAVARVRSGELRAIFTVDLFNEGVDIPEVDTVLLLRPTESATVFLQQLGRGLRWARGKSVLTVLDFIGLAHGSFRFDLRLRALLGGSRRQIAEAVEEDFPLLPPGCAIRLDRIARKAVLDNIRTAILRARPALLEDLRAAGPGAGLAAFLRESGRELEDVYAHGDARSTFSALRREAGFERSAPAPGEESLAKALGRMLHADDDERIDRWLKWLRASRPPEPAALDTREGRLQCMLFASIARRGRSLAEMPAAMEELWAAAPIRTELVDLLEILSDRIRNVAQPVDPGGVVPLASHATYSLAEVLGAYGAVGKAGSLLQLQTGVLWVENHRTDLLFITLEKSEKLYSPTTRYEDYPLSATQFHWESQNTSSPDSSTGRRYIEHAARGSRVALFVRERPKDGRGETAPYACLGHARYVRHESERPMRIVWELERAMPGGLYQAGKVAAG